MNIRKGDNVLVISGKDKGKKGKVFEVYPGKNGLAVEGVNIRKKHARPKRSGEKGQIIEKPASINISNVMVICSKCNRPTRIGFKISEGKKYRVCKKCEQEI
jgi:large subunit ribosomal protein L24